MNVLYEVCVYIFKANYFKKKLNFRKKELNNL